MPQILEMKTENGQLWVRVDITKEKSPVHLWTDEEAKAYWRRGRAELLEEIREKVIP